MTASSPPAEFFHPAALLVLGAMYGLGALVARELTVRWHGGWPTVFALGAAFGVVNEGLAAKSLFDPTWVDLGAMGGYGRAWGVNWAWATALVLYHAVVSVAIPIALVHVACRQRDERPWLSNRRLSLATLLLAVDVAVAFVAAGAYRPPVGLYAGAVVVVAAGVLLARLLARRGSPCVVSSSGSASSHCGRLMLVGFGWVVAQFVLVQAFPALRLPAAFAIAWLLAATVLAVVLVQRARSDARLWHGREVLALASGVMSLFLGLSVVHELQGAVGMSAVAALFATGLLVLWRRLGRDEAAGAPAGQAGSPGPRTAHAQVER